MSLDMGNFQVNAGSPEFGSSLPVNIGQPSAIADTYNANASSAGTYEVAMNKQDLAIAQWGASKYGSTNPSASSTPVFYGANGMPLDAKPIPRGIGALKQ